MTSSSKASSLKQEKGKSMMMALPTPSNGFQPTNLRRPPCPAPPLYPPDLEPEFELVIEPVNDIEAELAERKRRRNGILAKHTSTLVRGGDGEASASEDFELSKAKSLKLFGAADYDESAARREDAERALLHSTQDAMDIDEDEFEEVEEVVDEEDVDGMFAFDDDEKPKKKVVKKAKKSKPANMLPDGGTPTLGGTLDGKYDVFSIIGKGMFAVVVKACVVVAESGTLLPDATPKREVAIKTMRSQETMYKSSPYRPFRENVRMARAFLYCDGRVGLEFERNFEDFGKDVGLSIAAVKAYAIQTFLALSLFKKESITHTDSKPGNILISNNKTTLKVCDLGSAADASSAESTPTPCLASRFYRAPEIILGLPHDSSLDTWSVGCTLFELYTGRILFPGQTNRHMLQLHMECKARFNSKLIKKAKFGTEHFDDLGAFFVDSSSGGDGAKVFSSKAERDVKTRLLGGSGGETREVRDLVDLIEKCLVLDSGRRITSKALGHPFLKQ
ncbi:kinase-like domain-containing protein [Flagelloscypha sp. PMI_526]|nr:kinase-like domain-containing protein [Flagelloscypha sp. PMI_526]